MVRLLLSLIITIIIGLASRLHPIGWFFYDRILGEILYATAAYFLLAMIFFRRPAWLIAGIAFGCCFAVELFKLTDIPRNNQNLFLVRWFLGMVFDWINILYYFLGALLGASVDWATARMLGRSMRKMIARNKSGL